MMTCVRLYSRQRVVIVLAVICIIVFFTNRQAFLREFHNPSILPSIAHSVESSVDRLSPAPDSKSPLKTPPEQTTPPDKEILTATPDPPSAAANSRKTWPKRPIDGPRCGAWPDNADVVIVVKTGGTETFKKIPTQLMTFLQCAKDDAVIFSDMELDLAGKHIYDCLDNVTDKTKKSEDFDLYRTEKEYQAQGAEITGLDRASDAWKLDKYKNIHTAQKAYELRPGKSWYFFIDADTYIIWPNFFAWLKRLDPNEKLYLGSVVDVGKPPFAHGGSGYLLSKAAMAELVGPDAKEIAKKYDQESLGGCCGDQELAKSLFDKGVASFNVRPMINGEPARSIPFGPSHWCQPLVTMHHMSPEDINDFWQYEAQRENPNDILLMQDMYHTYIESKIGPFHDDWDNYSIDNIYKKSEDRAFGGWWAFDKPYYSFNACSKACKEDPRCFQFSYSDGECGFGAAFKLGWKSLPHHDYKRKSGWHMDKITKFISENQCNGPAWEQYA